MTLVGRSVGTDLNGEITWLAGRTTYSERHPSAAIGTADQTAENCVKFLIRGWLDYDHSEIIVLSSYTKIRWLVPLFGFCD